MVNKLFELNDILNKDCDFICSLKLCDVLLNKQDIGPWLILVPRISNITELHQLSDEQKVEYIYESSSISKMLIDNFSADKVNVAAIGNMVSQLHIHHVARFKTVYLWPSAIWGNTTGIFIAESKQVALIQKLKAIITAF